MTEDNENSIEEIRREQMEEIAADVDQVIQSDVELSEDVTEIVAEQRENVAAAYEIHLEVITEQEDDEDA